MELISVNGVEIPTAAIAAECQHHPAGSSEAARSAAARALVVRELLLQEARRLAIEAQPQRDEMGRTETADDAAIRQLIEDQVSTPKADPQTRRRYYDNNRDRFRSADIYEAAHILLSAPPADQPRYARAVTEAEAIIARLQQDPKAFADIARQRSDCPSATDGGRLGQLVRGQTTPEFETFLVALAEGQLCPQPIKTSYGVHVLRLDRHVAGREFPFAAVEARIAAFLEEASWRRAVAQYVQQLAGRARIAGIDIGGAQSPLVQ